MRCKTDFAIELYDMRNLIQIKCIILLHSFSKYLLSTRLSPTALRGAGDTTKSTVFALLEVTV